MSVSEPGRALTTPRKPIASVAVKAAPRRFARLRRLVRPLLALLGVAALVALVMHVGASDLLAVLARSARWLPLVLVVEVVRFAAEVFAMYLLYAGVRVRAPIVPLIRAHIAALPVLGLMPAGRAAAEAFKASALAPLFGGARATAVATSNQAISLMSGAVIAIVCAAGAYHATGISTLTGALFLHVLVSVAASVGLSLAMRRSELGGFIRARSAKAGQATLAYQDALRDHALFPLRALAATLFNRGLQILEIGILIAAVGGGFGLVRALLGTGVQMVGSSVGDLVPLQIGTTDGAFALAAPMLSITVADAVAVAVLLHVVQIFGAAVGALVPLFWRGPVAAPAPRIEEQAPIAP